MPDLVGIRYGRMLESPFAFFRGAALIMATDLAGTPCSGLRTQLCGDAHLSNFGVFATPERRMVFSINDFDETLPGPWEWDLKRLVAIVEVAARGNGLDVPARRRIVLRTARAYREAMREFAAKSNLEVWYASLDVERMMREQRDRVDPVRMRRLERDLAKARTRDSLRASLKLTRTVNGEHRIVSDPPLIVPFEELEITADPEESGASLRGGLRQYRRSLQSERRRLLEQFRFVHLARKVVGVGSVGTRCWIVLLMGRDDGDPLLLQIKEAQRSVLEGFAGTTEHANQGERVVAGQRLMQAASDIFLGWQRVLGGDGVRRGYYVASFHDGKGSVAIEALTAYGLEEYGASCGWTLARAHARSGDRIAIAAYLGSGEVFDRATTDFAAAYADLNESDYSAFTAAARQGRIDARAGLYARGRRDVQAAGSAPAGDASGPLPRPALKEVGPAVNRALGDGGGPKIPGLLVLDVVAHHVVDSRSPRRLPPTSHHLARVPRPAPVLDGDLGSETLAPASTHRRPHAAALLREAGDGSGRPQDGGAHCARGFPHASSWTSVRQGRRAFAASGRRPTGNSSG